jgi:transcriptional regulator of acetoin/glycerol metabolism
MDHDFPGNVRELENIIEQAFVLCRSGLIELHHLPPELRPAHSGAGGSSPMTLQAMEEYMIVETLRRHHGNRKRAARQLGIDPSTLYRKIRAAGIELPDYDGRSHEE